MLLYMQDLELASTHPACSTGRPEGALLRARSEGALKEAQERAGCVSARLGGSREKVSSQNS